MALALEVLSEKGLAELSRSQFYLTPCFPAGAGPDFVNAVVRFAGGFPPEDLLQILHDAETALGRTRSGRWDARVVDLDLLAVDDLIRPDLEGFETWRDLPLAEQQRRSPDDLVLPHPRIQDRAFVLVPLAEIAPDWRHPVLGHSAAELRDALPEAERREIRPLDAPEGVAKT